MNNLLNENCCMGDFMKNLKDHWDNIFSKTEEAKLGWYEKDTSQTFKLLKEIPEIEKAVVSLAQELLFS